MIVFFDKKRKSFIITNYKVMYSTLKHQSSLTKINIKTFVRYYLYFKIFYSRKMGLYMIVRNPLSRLESFYKNKMVKSPMNRPEHKGWQDCQKIFFEYVGIKSEMKHNEKARRIRRLTFSKFISLLPVNYEGNLHLAPQYFGDKIELSKFGLSIAINLIFDKILKLESDKDLQHLSSKLGIELNHRRNTTFDLDYDIVWKEDEINLVKKLYAIDFERYGYNELIATENHVK